LSATFQEKIGLVAVELTRERVRFWGIRSGLSVLDQGLTSGAGFLLNLFLARWLTSDGYGAFAVGFATLLFLSGYHNVLLLEPMTVLGPARYSAELTGYFWGQLKVHSILVVPLSVAILLVAAGMAVFGAQHALVTATAGSAVALPFVLLFWLVRRMCYVVQRPSIAVWAGVVYVALMVAGAFALHTKGWLGSGGAFVLMAAASVLAAFLPLRQLGLLSRGMAGSPWKTVAAENWNYGRWLVASAVLYPLSSQAQTYLAAGIMGLGAAGILRAMQIPALVMTQIVSAAALVMLPPMSQEFGMGRTEKLKKKAVFSTFALTGMAMLYELLLAIFAKPLEHILFGGKFAEYAWLIPVLGLVPVFTAFGMGFSMALRAVQKPHFDLIANAVAAPIGVLTAVLFIRLWGIGGAAFSLVAGSAAMGVVLVWSFVRLHKRVV